MKKDKKSELLITISTLLKHADKQSCRQEETERDNEVDRQEGRYGEIRERGIVKKRQMHKNREREVIENVF